MLQLIFYRFYSTYFAAGPQLKLSPSLDKYGFCNKRHKVTLHNVRKFAFASFSFFFLDVCSAFFPVKKKKKKKKRSNPCVSKTYLFYTSTDFIVYCIACENPKLNFYILYHIYVGGCQWAHT